MENNYSCIVLPITFYKKKKTADITNKIELTMILYSRIFKLGN